MQTGEQESSPLVLSLWMDEEAAATAVDELIPLDALERHFAGEQPADAVAHPSPAQWAYLHRPIVPLMDGHTGAGA